MAWGWISLLVPSRRFLGCAVKAGQHLSNIITCDFQLRPYLSGGGEFYTQLSKYVSTTHKLPLWSPLSLAPNHSGPLSTMTCASKFCIIVSSEISIHIPVSGVSVDTENISEVNVWGVNSSLVASSEILGCAVKTNQFLSNIISENFQLRPYLSGGGEFFTQLS